MLHGRFDGQFHRRQRIRALSCGIACCDHNLEIAEILVLLQQVMHGVTCGHIRHVPHSVFHRLREVR